MALTRKSGPQKRQKNGPKKVKIGTSEIEKSGPKKVKSPAQKDVIFFGEILDSVRNQHFCNAGLSSCPHTTTSARALDRTLPRVPTLEQ